VGPAYDAYDVQGAQQTRPMPIVPEVPAHGGDQDDDRGAARTGGPLFRDDRPQRPYEGPHQPSYGVQPQPQQYEAPQPQQY
jgi:phosphatidate cytidylyltransferase